MKIFLFLVMVSMMCLTQAPAWSAPVDIPTSLKGDADNGHIQVGAQGEWFSRKIKPSSGNKISGQAYVVKASVPLKYMGQWDWYGELGIVNNVTVKSNANDQTTKFDLEDAKTMLGGVGVTWKPIEWPELNHLAIFTDLKYRQIFNGDYDRVRVNGNDINSFDSTKTPEFREWQGALGVGARFFDSVVPYAGVTYSDVKVDTRATINGIDYAVHNASSRNKGGGVIGLEYMPQCAALKNMSFNAQARFGDENSYSGALVWKF
ncbi:MAG: hypothetical protein HQL22_10200 [Candidatus Omnitrophica bacterium]|nr:hypothetical protein [Candidatus Omnitrophota bacterium]